MTMTYNAVVLLLVLTSCRLGVLSTEVGNIATIERYNGENFGPYIVKDFHTHEPEQPSAVAQPLTGDDEGSGHYSALDGDTEEGDDTGSGLMPIEELSNDLQPKEGSPKTAPGLLTIEELAHDLRPKEGTAETMPEPPSVPSIEAVSEWAFVSETTSAQASSPPSPTITQPSETSTPAPPRSSSPALPPPATSSVSPDCHESCVSLMEAVTLEVLPEEVSFISEGEGVRMVCSVSVTDMEQEGLLEQIQLNWLFQPQTPPSSECSLDGQQYLAACEGFASVWEEQQRNSTHLTADILFTKLAVGNTGRYMCQVVAHCCGSMPQRQLHHSLTVWQADYKTELLVMSVTTTLLFLMVGFFLLCKRRRAAQHTRDYMAVLMVSAELPTTGGKVLHLPLQQDDDFDDRDSFSSSDSAAYP